MNYFSKTLLDQHIKHLKFSVILSQFLANNKGSTITITSGERRYPERPYFLTVDKLPHAVIFA